MVGQGGAGAASSPAPELLETLRHSDEYLRTLVEQLRRELLARHRTVLEENAELRARVLELEEQARELHASLEQLTHEVQPDLFADSEGYLINAPH